MPTVSWEPPPPPPPARPPVDLPGSFDGYTPRAYDDLEISGLGSGSLGGPPAGPIPPPIGLDGEPVPDWSAEFVGLDGEIYPVAAELDGPGAVTDAPGPIALQVVEATNLGTTVYSTGMNGPLLEFA